MTAGVQDNCGQIHAGNVQLNFSLSLLQMVSALHLTSIPLIWLIPILEEIYNTVLYPRPLDQESINPRLAAWPRAFDIHILYSAAHAALCARSLQCIFVRRGNGNLIRQNKSSSLWGLWGPVERGRILG